VQKSREKLFAQRSAAEIAMSWEITKLARVPAVVSLVGSREVLLVVGGGLEEVSDGGGHGSNGDIQMHDVESCKLSPSHSKQL